MTQTILSLGLSIESKCRSFASSESTEVHLDLSHQIFPANCLFRSELEVGHLKQCFRRCSELRLGLELQVYYNICIILPCSILIRYQVNHRGNQKLKVNRSRRYVIYDISLKVNICQLFTKPSLLEKSVL